MPLNLRKSISLLSLGTALVLQATPALAESVPTEAAKTEARCTGGAYQTWEPGLRLLPRNSTYTNKSSYDSCTTSDPNLVSAELDIATDVKASCALQSRSDGTLTWNDGSVSSLAIIRSGVDVIHGGQAYVSVGVVKDGPFQGNAVVITYDISPHDLTPCVSSDGLSSLSGPSTLRLIRLY
ncbi:hypothetical protein MYSTI_03499 [Myxococcus stipitatus DSM 14675]|uniref:Lipoprotein n=1 Tax=Myxococcus stipitatus (strain DSM 14675 / JCM 12634 / Mx s8) TaxID=1278073 RepID=L7U7D0_MYXSD|nr:hypothetical protein [Myxococcus stipitatus]AGC44811.1 hypothetical protein MYSTI_03499 [Myxococcus stipitatus DSM 14675]